MYLMSNMKAFAPLYSFAIIITSTHSFSQINSRNVQRWRTVRAKVLCTSTNSQLRLGESSWNGEVVSNAPDGTIRGCSIEKVDDLLCEWKISIDGVEADLGKFSEAIYRKITSDAKKMRFQGFRPGTIPPHLIPTYIAYTMDECAREATLEAMQQNNIRPFQDARNDFKFELISIPPIGKKGKSSKTKEKNKSGSSDDITPVVDEKWTTFTSMKEAIDCGWKVCQRNSDYARLIRQLSHLFLT
jgi:hypothetical protein